MVKIARVVQVNGKVTAYVRSVKNAAESESRSAQAVGVKLVCGRRGIRGSIGEHHVGFLP